MKIAVQKNHLGEHILYISLDPFKNGKKLSKIESKKFESLQKSEPDGPHWQFAVPQIQYFAELRTTFAKTAFEQ